MSKKGKSNEVVNPLALPVEYKLREYRILAVLGKGGFGITYLAEDLNLGKKVAIKELLPDSIATRGARRLVVPQSPDRKADFDWARESFIEEARILADLVHPNIVGVMRLLEANGTAYMVMEYVEGEPLRERIKRREPPAQVVVDEYLRAILSGLRRVHERDLLHRDIKPENILVRASDRQPVLIDFGAARTRASGQSQHVTSIISPGYSPWEQYSTEIHLQGPWSDIYALAAVIYHWIAGERPPESPQRVSRVNRDEADPYEPLSSRAADLGYDVEFLEAIDRALSIRETDRPQSVAEWELDLGLRAMSAAEMEAQTDAASGRASDAIRPSQRGNAARSGLPSSRIQAAGPPEPRSENPTRGSNRWLVGALVSSLLVIGVLIAMLLGHEKRELEEAPPNQGSALAGAPPAPPVTEPGSGGVETKPEPPPQIPAPPPVPEPAAPTVTVTTRLESREIEKDGETVFELAANGGRLTDFPKEVPADGLSIRFLREKAGEEEGRFYLYRIIGEQVGFHTIPSIRLRAGTREIETDSESITVTAPPPPPPPPPPPKSKEERVRETLLSYLAAGETDSSDEQNRYYASSVNYFNESKTRYQIEAEYQTYRARWPIRSYEVNGPISVSGYGDSWRADFLLDYVTGDGILLKKGRSEKRYGMVFSGETPQITSVETVREISNETFFSKAGYQQIIQFIDLFCESGSSSYTGLVPRSNLYDDEVDYFDKTLSRARVFADQAEWNARFRSHSYQRTGEPSVSDLKERKIQIVFPMAFENYGPKGSNSGTVEVTLRVRYSADAESMWIYYENSRKL